MHMQKAIERAHTHTRLDAYSIHSQYLIIFIGFQFPFSLSFNSHSFHHVNVCWFRYSITHEWTCVTYLLSDCITHASSFLFALSTYFSHLFIAERRSAHIPEHTLFSLSFLLSFRFAYFNRYTQQVWKKTHTQHKNVVFIQQSIY